MSSTLLGAAVGSLTGGGAADALGRRKAFMLCAVPMFTGPLLSALATSLNQMVAGRFLAGLAIGLSSALVPLYISEVRPGYSRPHWAMCSYIQALRRLVLDVKVNVMDGNSVFQHAHSGQGVRIVRLVTFATFHKL